MTEPTLYLVEDDPGHAQLITRNLRRSLGEITIHHLTAVDAAVAAITAVRGPILVVLDLNLGGESGLEVLQALRSAEATRYALIVVMSSTDDPAEIERCYALGCNLFVQKPVDYEAFKVTIHHLGLVLKTARIPEVHP